MTLSEPQAGTWRPTPFGRVAAPLREQVTVELRQAILSFQFTPGQRLVERELIERLGVSRTTVREALRELAAEGLVEMVPQKGAVVAAPSRVDAADLYEVRAVLESLMVGLFVARATAAEVADLQAAVEGFALAIEETSDVTEILSIKSRFYEVLIRGARSTVLQQLLEGIQARVHLLRATSLRGRERREEAVSELRAVVDAVASRDAPRAAALCAHHVRSAAVTALETLGEPASPPRPPAAPPTAASQATTTPPPVTGARPRSTTWS
jgi:DNA-binding GntR family transcriptional regulator